MNKKHLPIVERMGLERPASYHRRGLNRLAKTRPKTWAIWKEIHLGSCTQPAVVAASEHFMVVCRKPYARGGLR